MITIEVDQLPNLKYSHNGNTPNYVDQQIWINNFKIIFRKTRHESVLEHDKIYGNETTGRGQFSI